MRYTMRSRKTTDTFSFFAPNDGGYIRLEYPGQEGVLGAQICEGGGFMGSTITCSSESDLATKCRKWYRQYMRHYNKHNG